MELSGVGSRVKHPSYGVGVIVRLNRRAYEICFIDHGIKAVRKDFELELIERIEPEYNVSFRSRRCIDKNIA